MLVRREKAAIQQKEENGEPNKKNETTTQCVSGIQCQITSNNVCATGVLLLCTRSETIYVERKYRDRQSIPSLLPGPSRSCIMIAEGNVGVAQHHIASPSSSSPYRAYYNNAHNVICTHSLVIIIDDNKNNILVFIPSSTARQIYIETIFTVRLYSEKAINQPQN